MFKNIKSAISNYLFKNPDLASRLDGADPAIVGLPSEYDSTPFETVFNGCAVHTVGEYKAAVRSASDMNFGNADATDWNHY